MVLEHIGLLVMLKITMQHFLELLADVTKLFAPQFFEENDKIYNLGLERCANVPALICI